MNWRERDGVRWLEAELAGARAAFTTRLGGVSEGSYASLNLGLANGDARDAVRTNRRRATAALGLDPDAVLSARQVHGTAIEEHDRAPAPNRFAEAQSAPTEADGQLTRTPGLAPLVLVADCLPIALAGPEVVAMLHCGWRGLAAGIVERGVGATAATAAAVGPGIGPCCYEVGEEVAAEFTPLGDVLRPGRRLDLPAVARRLLTRAGVDAVETAELCTSCDPELFFSARRDGGHASGRQGGFAWRADRNG